MLRLYIPLAVFVVGMLFPFYWMLITSIKPNRELYNAKIMPLIVYQPTLKHYVDLLYETNFLLWTYNTMLVAVVTTVISLVIGNFAALAQRSVKRLLAYSSVSQAGFMLIAIAADTAVGRNCSHAAGPLGTGVPDAAWRSSPNGSMAAVAPSSPSTR